MNNGKYGGDNSGTVTAGLAFGGEPPGGPSGNRGTTETFNGTNWTEVNDLNTGRESIRGTGTQPSTVAAGGGTPNVLTETWNGTNWTEVNDLNTGRASGSATGADSTAAIYIGSGSPGAFTESWNGTNWTEVGDLNTARSATGAGGPYTSAIAMGGAPVPGGKGALTETWNGTNWTEDGDLSTARDGGGGSGTSNTSGLYFGGRNEPTVYANTEEFTGAGAAVTRTFTDS